MKIKILYDLPDGINPEDGLVCSPPFFLGVTDGVSGLYDPSKGPILFSGKSGGRMVSDIVTETFSTAAKEDSLGEVILRAGEKVHKMQESLGFYEQDYTDFLAGATFAIAKLDKNQVEIIQCGDALAVMETKNGEVLATKNQVFRHDTEARRIIAALMKKNDGNRTKMWEEFSPILSKMRRQNANGEGEASYGLFNGQLAFKKHWQRIALPWNQAKLLILFSDGFIYYPDSKNEQFLARKVLNLYRQGGLPAILKETRNMESTEKEISHIDYAEATAISVEF